MALDDLRPSLRAGGGAGLHGDDVIRLYKYLEWLGQLVNDIAEEQDLGGATQIHGQVSRTTQDTVNVLAQGAYQPTGITPVLDTIVDGMSTGVLDPFSLRNTSGITRTLRFYGSFDAYPSSGNNVQMGIKLAKNGVEIDETECRATQHSSLTEAKLVTSWMVEVDPDDEVSLWIANHTNTTDLVVSRGRLVASRV